MKYFGIIDKNVAAIFPLQWKIGNISDMFLHYSVLCGIINNSTMFQLTLYVLVQNKRSIVIPISFFMWNFSSDVTWYFWWNFVYGNYCIYHRGVRQEKSREEVANFHGKGQAKQSHGSLPCMCFLRFHGSAGGREYKPTLNKKKKNTRVVTPFIYR